MVVRSPAVLGRSAMLVGRGKCDLSVMDGANRRWSFTAAEVSEAERPGSLLGLLAT